jgi:hypothetical protein
MLLDWLMDSIACFALLPHVRSTPSCAGPWLRTTHSHAIPKYRCGYACTGGESRVLYALLSLASPQKIRAAWFT